MYTTKTTAMKYLWVALLCITTATFAQPKPGDVFKEYSWTVPPPTKPGQEVYLRVCGDGYYEDQTRKGQSLFEASFMEDGWLKLQDNLDLTDAVRAEVLVEKVLCHDGSTGLAVKFNEGAFIKFPEAAGIPQPQSEYLHHFYPTVAIPLQNLKPGDRANKFRFTLDKTQRWGMPQNLVYGMVIRIYYKPTKLKNKATITGIKNGDALGETVALNVTGVPQIKTVDYVGYYEGINFEGDGIFTQWHYNYYKGNIKNHIGSATNGAYTWNTEWIPDQEKGFSIAARVTDNNGIIQFTTAVDNLRFARPYKVELCKPYDIPRRWATREREFQSAFDLKGNPDDVEKFKVVTTTWSPGYMNGIYLNDFLLIDREACKYCFHVIDKVIEHPEFLQRMNAIKTGYTPLMKGKMTHGTEIQYPGPTIVVKYKPANK
jgi:hypothetical protein